MCCDREKQRLHPKTYAMNTPKESDPEPLDGGSWFSQWLRGLLSYWLAVGFPICWEHGLTRGWRLVFPLVGVLAFPWLVAGSLNGGRLAFPLVGGWFFQ